MEPTPPPPVSPYHREGQDACPRCGSPDVHRVKYTWWGGLLFPAIMSLTRCGACRLQFNGKTRKDVSGMITAFAVVGAVSVAILIVMVIAAVSLTKSRPSEPRFGSATLSARNG